MFFANQKNDQTGDRSHYPRHIYANPFNPEICPILAFGVHFLCFPLSFKQEKIFHGTNQDERFLQTLQRAFNEDSIFNYLKEYNTKPDELGSHSIRKGSATYCSMGNSGDCPIIAVQLRAGWSLPGVQDTYLQYDAAGDMNVGRVLFGLPCGTPEFATLPPFFNNDQDIKQIIKNCFLNCPEKFYNLFNFFLL